MKITFLPEWVLCFWVLVLSPTSTYAAPLQALIRGLPDQPKQLHPHYFGGSPGAQVTERPLRRADGSEPFRGTGARNGCKG